MKVKQDKTYRLLKKKHIIPSIIGMLLTIVLLAVLATVLAGAIIGYVMDDKIEAEYKSVSEMVRIYDYNEKSGSKYAFEELAGPERDYIVVDKDNNPLTVKGENTCSFKGGEVSGVDLSTLKDKELCHMRNEEVGFVFQFYNLVPNLNVEDNIALPLMIAGKNKNDYKEKLDECLKIIGMEDKRKLTPRELSGGQQQRVAIARALVFDPKILFLDEPIGNLDTKTGMKIMELFKEINKKYNKTIVQVTHSGEASKYGLSFQGNFQFFKLISGSRSGIVFFMLKIILKY